MMDYNSCLSEKAKQIKPSGIRKFFDIASEMEDVISLGVGEPDFRTPWHIRKVGINSLDDGKTWYTSNQGLSKLRYEINNFLNRRYNLTYDPDGEILVTVGGSEAIDLCIRALIDEGDEVLIPEPSFVCYSPITLLSGGKPISIKTRLEDSFRLTPDALKSKITPRTKLLILPYPNNPTGSVMKKEHLEEIAAVLKDTNIIVLSDEIYSELTYGHSHVSFASIDNMRERTVLVNGFSKAFAMTGWRLGYLAAPRELAKHMIKIHQYAIMCAPTVSQYAAIEAMKNGQDDIVNMREQYNIRRLLLVNELNNMGLKCFMPEGAFYAFPSIKSTGLGSDEFCEKLLFSKKVAVVPGNAFGESGEGFVRISYSKPLDQLEEALKRIKQFCESEKNGAI